MARTSTFSVRITSDVRKKIEHHAQILRIKPSALAAHVLRDCVESWATEYAETLYKVLIQKEEEKK